MSSVLIVQAHPDGGTRHYCHALAEAYATGAVSAGHMLKEINLGEFDVPLLRSQAQWESRENLPDFVINAQRMIEEADHIVFIYPLWLGSMPALLKAWLEQVLRADFAFSIVPNGMGWDARLGGRSARIVVTMGMPAFFYRLFYMSHSLRAFERNVLKFAGVKPLRHSVIGSVESKSPKGREKWLSRMAKYGEAAT